MYKASYKDIKWLLGVNGSKEVKELFKRIQPNGVRLAYYSPSQANWSYQVILVKHLNKIYELVTVFGCVEGGREIGDLI